MFDKIFGFDIGNIYKICKFSTILLIYKVFFFEFLILEIKLIFFFNSIYISFFFILYIIDFNK